VARDVPLVEGKIYHVFTKSIANYKIFRNKHDYKRMIALLKFYRKENPPTKFSAFLEIKDKEKFFHNYIADKDNLVDIIAYCLMPTHLHLVLTQLKPGGISIFMSNVLNSYTRYFNNKNKRKGPLWQSRFKSVEVKTNEQHLHLTRYIHLNPVSEGLVDKPEQWSYSSYNEYINRSKNSMCNYSKYIDIEPDRYIDFVTSRIDYQKELSELKKLWLE